MAGGGGGREERKGGRGRGRYGRRLGGKERGSQGRDRGWGIRIDCRRSRTSANAFSAVFWRIQRAPSASRQESCGVGCLIASSVAWLPGWVDHTHPLGGAVDDGEDELVGIVVLPRGEEERHQLQQAEHGAGTGTHTTTQNKSNTRFGETRHQAWKARLERHGNGLQYNDFGRH